MKTRIKILFVIESLTLAGSEKSLIALLSNLDSDKYEIDLQLFSFGGELEKYVPSHVSFLKPMPYIGFASKPFLQNITSGNYKFLKAKITYSINLRLNRGNVSDTAAIYWKSVRKAFFVQEKIYDVAIAYAQGAPTYYVMDKVKAKKKICWVNANMQFSKSNLPFEKKYYQRYDNIVAVSQINLSHFVGIFPDLQKKTLLIPDMLDYKSITKMAELYEPNVKKNKYRLLTVARLEKGMKGLDISIETARVLKEKGIDYIWYIIGKGSYRKEMERFIRSNKLENNLVLLGTTPNPYPYYKAVDLYVQTSRSESYGISIAEARLLNIPVVTTRFDSVAVQMIDGKNGLVTDMSSEAVAEGIIRLMNNKILYNSIVEYLKQEPKEILDTIEKFDLMVNTLAMKSQNILNYNYE